MRVAVDARHLGRGRGVARYLESLLGALPAVDPASSWHALVPSEHAGLVPEGVEAVAYPAPSRLVNAAAALIGRPRLDRLVGGADVVWLPAPAPVAWSAQVPAVVSLHDLSWEERPADFTPYERAWHAATRPRRLAARAARVACASRATREAMLGAGWPVSPADAVVIPEAPMAGGPPVPERPGSYLLFVGALEPRKGIATLAAGMAVARGMGVELPLVVVGDGRERDRLEGLPGVELVGRVDEAELATLYAGAAALVLPSLLEGFGLPPVEAARMGVPTVATDLPALRENLGAGFLAVPAGDSTALGEAIFSLATDAALRRRLGLAARDAVAGLSWETSARSLAGLLREAAAAGAS